MNASTSSVPSVPAGSIAVIGAGRLGSVLARALVEAGFDVRGLLERGDAIPATDLVVLCVPDAAIHEAAEVARPHARLIGHVSGATGLDDVDFSIHPLQTFTGSESPVVFRGIGAAIDGRTPEALVIAEQLAHAIGAHPFRVDDAHRAGYHASASIASNLLFAVLDAAEQVAGSAGIPSAEARAILAPLVRQTVENWVEVGAAEALTGPIARGDEGTVARQRAAVDVAVPDLLPLFDALIAQTRTLAATDGDGVSSRFAVPERPSSRFAVPERGAQRRDEGRSGTVERESTTDSERTRA
ncbi:Rossmann-like and DUF2520 domain-containing protein [Microbacterium azadirachtae]|uniref:DUF2520 domain-containing protein n=1 Tax=Microbacterium azadirachtae TaxID=582680 RepID=A0A0F0LKV8_9MICO|nr:DUF2520 domain-containing protein [Microbacterium azadirachtae]KJL33773.1 hypothetical protein RS86_01570 [Microbacterium azadirachtae]